MSEQFARIIIEKLDRRVRFEKNLATKKALKHMRDVLLETMIEFGHDMK